MSLTKSFTCRSAQWPYDCTRDAIILPSFINLFVVSTFSVTVKVFLRDQTHARRSCKRSKDRSAKLGSCVSVIRSRVKRIEFPSVLPRRGHVHRYAVNHLCTFFFPRSAFSIDERMSKQSRARASHLQTLDTGLLLSSVLPPGIKRRNSARGKSGDAYRFLIFAPIFFQSVRVPPAL